MTGPIDSELVPVSAGRHGPRRWRRFASYAFAKPLRTVPVVLGEHEQIAANLPILFAGHGAGLAPVALLRVAATGDTALVAPNGVWRGSYVPSLLRVHPFSARPAGDAFELLVNESSGLITDDPADERFFDDDGTLAAPLAAVVDFFRQRAEAAQRTAAACRELEQAGLLTDPPEGSPLAGFRVIARDPLADLPRTRIATLHRSGALALAQAHLVARHHIGLLAHAEARLSEPAPEPAPAAAPGAPADPLKAREAERLSGFLDALAEAQDSDPFGPGSA
ncbi:MAG: SapC family protein [Rhodobacteraceae bacterium]|nr:SapC family protein [Paracoccaceae bacterium]